MTLRVPIEQFAETARRVLRVEEAYLSASDGSFVVTAYHPDKRVRVMARATGTEAEATERLKKAGLRVQKGIWLDVEDQEDAGLDMPYVAAVAYATGEAQPGVWVDAYDDPPTHAQALRSLYDDFRETGELGDVPFEEFVRLANPTVVVVSPTELRSFAEGKNE